MTVPGTAPTTYSRFFAFWIDPQTGLTVGSPDVTIFRLRHGAADGDINGRFAWAQGAATGTFTIRATDTVTTQTLTFSNVRTGFWNLCQVRCTINTGALATDAWSVRLNGVEQTGTAVNFASAGHASFDFGILGQNNALAIATDLDVFFDDIILDDASAAFQIPDASFLSFHEANATVTNNWVIQGGPANAQTALTDDDINTRVTADVDARVCEVGLTDTSGTLPTTGTLVVAVYGSLSAFQGVGPAAGDIIMRYKDGATNGANTTITTAATATTVRSAIVNSVKPSGGSWTQSAVNGASFYMESDIGAAETVRVDEQWHYAEVQVKINLDDPLTQTDAIVSINVDVSLTDPPGSLADSSGNARWGTRMGSVLPVLVASPFSGFGNALQFDGVDRDDLSSGVNLGVTAAATTAMGGFTVEAKIRRDRSGVSEIIVGKWGSAAAEDNFVLDLDGATNKVNWILLKSDNTAAVAISNAVLATGNHTLAGVWDGAKLLLFVDGVLQTSQPAITAIKADDGVTPTWIGRWKDLTSGAGAPFPFQGVIDEVRISNIARYSGTYTPSVTPFVADANTLVLYHLDSTVTELALEESVAIAAEVSVADALTLADTVASINVDVSLNDALTLLDEAGNVIYLPGGGGGSDRKRYIPINEE